MTRHSPALLIGSPCGNLAVCVLVFLSTGGFVSAGADQKSVESTTGRFLASTHRSQAGTMPYRLLVPKNYDVKRSYPLLLCACYNVGLSLSEVEIPRLLLIGAIMHPAGSLKE